jgi:hypothetical protein
MDISDVENQIELVNDLPIANIVIEAEYLSILDTHSLCSDDGVEYRNFIKYLYKHMKEVCQCIFKIIIYIFILLIIYLAIILIYKSNN